MISALYAAALKGSLILSGSEIQGRRGSLVIENQFERRQLVFNLRQSMCDPTPTAVYSHHYALQLLELFAELVWINTGGHRLASQVTTA